MKRRVLGALILAMVACLSSCGTTDAAMEGKTTQSKTQTEVSSGIVGTASGAEENNTELSAEEVLEKLLEKRSVEYAKIKMNCDVTFMIQSNVDTSFIRNYEDIENTFAALTHEGEGYCTSKQEWIGNSAREVLTANQYSKDGKLYLGYEYADGSEAWYVTEMKDTWKDMDQSFSQSLIPDRVAKSEDGGYILTGTTDPEKGRIFLDLIQQYRVKAMEQIVLNYELHVDKDFNLVTMKFTLDTPYNEMTNAVDPYDENWTTKVVTVQSYELECYDINVKNEIVIPKAAADTIPIK